MDHDTEPAPVRPGPVLGRRQRATLADAWRETKAKVIVSAGGTLIAALTLGGILMMSWAARIDAASAVAKGNRGEVAAKQTGEELDATYDDSRERNATNATAITVLTVRLEREEARADMLERLVLSLLNPAQRRRYQPPPKPKAQVPVLAVQAPMPATPEAAAAQAAKEPP